jgi:flagella basal body P-ring formation protein FlgA
MKRAQIFKSGCLIGAAVFLAAGLLSVSDSLAATLRHHVVIRDDVVRLGDIFQNAGQHASRIVLQAPEPGKRITLNVQWLYHASRSYGVKWKPLSTLDQAVLERSAILISTEQIRESIHAGIRNKLGKSDKFEIDLDNRLLQMHLPGEAMPSVKIQRLQLDPQTRRFSAMLMGGEGRAQMKRRITATGRYHKLLQIPVLVRRMRSGEIIEQRDIRKVTLRADKIDMNALHDAEDLIGMSPLRTLSADRAIKRSEIRMPVLVPKGSIVTMVFQTSTLTLTAQGKALQDGSKGDTIRVLNAKTHKTIEGTVVNSGTVTVKSADRVALR